jgi:hypothetical protein
MDSTHTSCQLRGFRRADCCLTLAQTADSPSGTGISSCRTFGKVSKQRISHRTARHMLAVVSGCWHSVITHDARCKTVVIGCRVCTDDKQRDVAPVPTPPLSLRCQRAHTQYTTHMQHLPPITQHLPLITYTTAHRTHDTHQEHLGLLCSNTSSKTDTTSSTLTFSGTATGTNGRTGFQPSSKRQARHRLSYVLRRHRHLHQVLCSISPLLSTTITSASLDTHLPNSARHHPSMTQTSHGCRRIW